MITCKEICSEHAYSRTDASGQGHSDPKTQSKLSRPIPQKSVERDHGCTSMIYFDNAGDNVTLTLYRVTMTSQKPCLHNNKFDCSKTNGLNEVNVFSIKYRCYSDILYEKKQAYIRSNNWKWKIYLELKQIVQ